MNKTTRGVLVWGSIVALFGAAAYVGHCMLEEMRKPPAPQGWSYQQADTIGQQIMALVQQTDTPDQAQAESLGHAAYALGQALDALDAGLLDQAARDRLAADLRASRGKWPSDWVKDIDAAIARLEAK